VFEDVIETVGRAADGVGVVVIVAGVGAAAALAVRDVHTMAADQAYTSLRRRIGRAILLGLEILVAADIIRTVAVSPTLASAGALAIIVAIRTVLSFSLEVELEGRWPWQRTRSSSFPD
jgi:uncharacterized membrane protein